MDLFFGTTNPGKLRELGRLVAGLPIRVVSPGDLGRPLPEVVEDGRTFAENAAKKAAAWARFVGLHALADDSGLCVDALGGAPGVHSARWSEEDPAGPSSPVRDLAGVAAADLGPVPGRPPGGPERGTRLRRVDRSRASRDERNNDKLLAALAGVPDARRGAEYQAVLALARPDGTIFASVTGVCRGRIGHARRGSGGFGYDPLFVPEADPTRTMAELPAEEKDAISHRGDAFRKLRAILEGLARA